jgi:hypothetical protein
MKRCPQCEFTFHDDDHFCDFDGTELSVIIERPVSSQNFSALSAMLPSLVLSIVRSNLSLAILALAGIVLSAVLVGYYSASEVESKGETGDFVAALPPPTQDLTANLVPEAQDSATISVHSDQTPAQTSAKAPARTRTPDTVTKRRATRATRVSSSTASLAMARRTAAFRSRTRFRSSTHKLEATGRRHAEREYAVRRAVDGSNKQLLARNQKRSGSREQGTQQRSAAGVGNIIGMAKSQPRSAETVAGRESENAPKKKESRVIVMLKKTGRILTRPFKFLTRV